MYPPPELQFAGFELGSLSSHIYAPFDVRRFASARILWLNRTWFLELGIDIHDQTTRSTVETWLLDNFACSVVQADEPEELYAGAPQVRHADRYGGTGGALHGGSGRSFCKDGFIAKGIGRTPLVAKNADWYHTHGCLWFEEAVREAVASEVLSRLAPHTAVRSLAIIDTGSRIYWGDGTTGERRAILVRPNFTRLAHLERSLYFGGGGLPDSPQYLDALRTRDVAHALAKDGGANFGSPKAPLSVQDAFGRIGGQIAFNHVNRLWPGPFLSSNMTTDGRWADFGSFRSLPTWSRAVGASKDPAFGEERHHVSLAAASVTRSLAKELGSGPAHSEVMTSFDRAYEQGFAASVRELLPGGDLLSDAAISDCVHAFRTAFHASQRVRVDAGSAQWSPRADRHVNAAFDAVREIYRKGTPAWSAKGRSAAFRILDEIALGRPRLHREAMIAEVAALNAARADPIAEYVDTRIADEVPRKSVIDRSWLVVDAVASTYSRALLCIDPLTGEHKLELQGAMDGSGTTYLFDQRAPFSSMPGGRISGASAAVQVPLKEGIIPDVVRIGDFLVRIRTQI